MLASNERGSKSSTGLYTTHAWEQRTLGDVAEHFQYGLNAAAKDFDGLNKYIRITDIDENYRNFDENNLTSPDTDLDEADNYMVKKGDILFARTGASTGKTYIHIYNDSPVYFAGFLIRARIQNTFLPEFIYQNTLTKKYNTFIKVMSQRSGQPGVNAQEYSSYSLGIPSLPEQTVIGNFFRTLDDAITLHKRKLDGLKELKRGYLQQMFPQAGENLPRVRLAGFTEPWQEQRLGEVVNRVTRKNKDLESTLALTISAQYGLIAQKDFFNKEVASKDVSNYYLIKNGEFAYNKSYSNGYPWGVVKRLDNYEIGVLSTLYIVFKPTIIYSEFLAHYYETTHWYNEVAQYAAEGARNHGLLNIATSDFFETVLTIPTDSNEQATIGNFFRTLDGQIIAQGQKLSQLKQLKSAYLQKLFV